MPVLAAPSRRSCGRPFVDDSRWSSPSAAREMNSAEVCGPANLPQRARERALKMIVCFAASVSGPGPRNGRRPFAHRGHPANLVVGRPGPSRGSVVWGCVSGCGPPRCVGKNRDVIATGVGRPSHVSRAAARLVESGPFWCPPALPTSSSRGSAPWAWTSRKSMSFTRIPMTRLAAPRVGGVQTIG